MRITNKRGLPDALVRAIERDLYDNPYDLSVTQLIDPPRLQALKARHIAEITVDASECIRILRGNAIHQIVEWGKGPDDIAERRFMMKVAGREVGYKPDLLQHHQGRAYTLYDYKPGSIAGMKHGIKPEQVAQGNCYRFGLTEHEKLAIPYVTFVYFVHDYRNYERKIKGENYPDCEILPLSMTEMWSPARTEQYMADRIVLHDAAADLADEDLPLCTNTERWQSGHKWKVKKPANQRASKTFDTQEEAETWRKTQKKPQDYEVIDSPSEYTRCNDWCKAFPFCNQANPDPVTAAPKPTEVVFVDSDEQEF